MGVSIIVGGQWGSEGKGKTTLFFTKKLAASDVVRVGGPNSGHTIIYNGKRMAFQILPVSAVLPNVTCILPAGSYIDLEILQREIKLSGIDKSRLKIHPNAVIITQVLKNKDSGSDLPYSIGSTGSGTGAAVLARVSRNDKELLLAKYEPALKEYVCDTSEYLRDELNKGKEVIVEGTQGFGLSLLHTPEYPYATSRDTTAAGFLSEAGLSPLDITNVIMTLRAFPIRVAGHSGNLPNETTWAYVTQNAKADEDLTEKTTVTNRVRRVAFFDANIVKKAIAVNNPNIIVLNHCDYFDYSIHNKEKLTEKVQNGILTIEEAINKNIDYIGTGEETIFLYDK